MNIFKNLQIDLYGESHSPVIGFKLTNIPAGFLIDAQSINKLLILRQGLAKINTSRKEQELFEFKSGISDQLTTGQPIVCEIKQSNFKTSDYIPGIIRPSHADLSAYLKWGDKYNNAGGSFFSGRMSVLYVIAGEICRQIINNQAMITKLNLVRNVNTRPIEQITVYSHVSQVGTIIDQQIEQCSSSQLQSLLTTEFPVINEDVKTKMIAQIEQIAKSGDSIGGKVTTIINGCSLNLGDKHYNSFEGKLSVLLFALGGIKALEFGIGTEFASALGSEVTEQIVVTDQKLQMRTNFNGGINGGITNGINNVVFTSTIKPPASIFNQIQTVQYDLEQNQFTNINYQLQGRHDAFIGNRVLFAINAVSYICLLDEILTVLTESEA